MNVKRFIKGLVIVPICALSFTGMAASQNYSVVDTIKVGGEGGWDFLTVDDQASRLYLSHNTIVNVVDLKSKTVVGTIPDTKGVHGIAIAKDLNKGYVSNGKDSSVTIFDLKTLKTITKIAVTGKGPDAIMYDKFSHQVFVFNGKSSNATVIDAKENKVVGSIALDGKPEVCVTNDSGLVYVNLEDKSVVLVINAKQLKIEQKWPLAPGDGPTGLAIDKKNNRLFSGCGNHLMVVMDSRNGKVISTLPIGDHVDGVAFDPAVKCAFSSNGEGNITVVQEVSPDSFKVAETVQTQKGAKTITLNPQTHHLYLSVADFGPAPQPSEDEPKPRPKVIEGTFKVLDVAQGK